MSEELTKPPATPRAAELTDESPAGLVEVAGRVKWFDAAKGYGFIVPDNGEADVLIHVTVLRRDGFVAIHEGARVVVEATRRDRGLQVLKVISVSEPEAGYAAVPSPARPRARLSSSLAIST